MATAPEQQSPSVSRQVLAAATISHVRQDAREWADWQVSLALRTLQGIQRKRAARKAKARAEPQPRAGIVTVTNPEANSRKE